MRAVKERQSLGCPVDVGTARADHCNDGTVDGRTGQLDVILYCIVDWGCTGVE